MSTSLLDPLADFSHFDKDNKITDIEEIDPFTSLAEMAETDPFAPAEEIDPFVPSAETAESDPFAPAEEIDPFAETDPFANFEISDSGVESLKEESQTDVPPESFFEEPIFENPSSSLDIENGTKKTKMNNFISDLEELSESLKNQETEIIVLPEIEEKFLMKKKESKLPSLVFSQNEKSKDSQDEKTGGDKNSQDEKAVNSHIENLAQFSDGLTNSLLYDNQQTPSFTKVPLQRVFFEGFQQEPITIQTTLIEARPVSSLGTPLASEWAYDNARGPVFSSVIEKDPEQTNERGIIESLPALLLRLGFLRFQYHTFSLQAYQNGHLGIGQVLEQFNAMLETAMKKFSGLSTVSTYGLQLLHMETTGPGVFISEETFENLHWLLCEEERFHLVLLPELSKQMAAAGQSLVYEALLQFSSSTALRFAWLTTTYNKLFTEMIYRDKDKTGWVCLSCGHILFEKEPFDCPFCAALPCSFVLLKQFGYFIEDAKLIEK